MFPVYSTVHLLRNQAFINRVERRRNIFVERTSTVRILRHLTTWHQIERGSSSLDPSLKSVWLSAPISLVPYLRRIPETPVVIPFVGDYNKSNNTSATMETVPSCFFIISTLLFLDVHATHHTSSFLVYTWAIYPVVFKNTHRSFFNNKSTPILYSRETRLHKKKKIRENKD